MRIYKYICSTILKIIFICSLIFITNVKSYGQDLQDATISLSFSEENETKTIIATALDSSGLPIEELDLYFYVKRTFSLLPIGDIFNTTDESGVVAIEFPQDLPGDTEGNVLLIVKIMESDLYNDLEIKKNIKWGTPIQINQTEEERSLWAAAANAPITLIVAVSFMIIAVWYIIFYIVFILFKISNIKSLKY